MTPAEKGQEQPNTIYLEGDFYVLRDDYQALEKELEMCQRYFPFMRRSRDEAVKREKALREALENALAADTESETRHIIYAALDQSGKEARR